MQLYQQTICHTVYAQGVGLHTGHQIDLAIHPAKAGSGIRFLRADLPGSEPILAEATAILDTRLATTIANATGFVSTTEHLLAACYALGIDNALVEVSGPEVPVFDGSAVRFVEMLQDAGIRTLTAPRSYLIPVAPIELKEQDRWIRIEPAFDGLHVDCQIAFDHPAIGAQQFACKVDGPTFRSRIAAARTFGFLHEIEMLRASGLGLGGSLDNAVVINGEGVINEEGLRFPDEFVRHKTLDLLGDLALVGLPILGRVTSYKSGHALNAQLTQHLLANPESWERFVPAVPEAAYAAL
jgi:UDP-3-O-[3-hydroxymyristoyl] N-acetylglucosamine deacetylase